MPKVKKGKKTNKRGVSEVAGGTGAGGPPPKARCTSRGRSSSSVAAKYALKLGAAGVAAAGKTGSSEAHLRFIEALNVEDGGMVSKRCGGGKTALGE